MSPVSTKRDEGRQNNQITMGDVDEAHDTEDESIGRRRRGRRARRAVFRPIPIIKSCYYASHV